MIPFMIRTGRTARSRTSGENLFVVPPVMAPSYSEVGASGKPGAVQDDLPKAQWLLGDRGDEADWFREVLEAKGIQACIPGRKSRIEPVKDDKRPYRRRSRIEIMFGRLKDWRSVAIRYDRCPTVFFSANALAATVLFRLRPMNPDPAMSAWMKTMSSDRSYC